MTALKSLRDLIMAPVSSRASLEPLTPALVGIGLLHVLGGIVFWTVLPLLPSERDVQPRLPADVVWRTPADFTGEVLSRDPPEAVAARVSEGRSAPVPVAAPAPAKPASTLLVPSGGGSVSALSSQGLSQLPPDTLSQLQKSLGTSAGMGGGMLNGLSTPILGEPQRAAAAEPVATSPPARPEPAAPPPVQPGQGREANKYITLSAISDVPLTPAKPSLNLLDIAKLNDLERARQISANVTGLDAVDDSLQQTLMRAWVPPSIELVPVNQRRVRVELVVFRDGSVKNAVIVAPSGSGPLDASVREALARVTKIPESLPASYSKERYAVRVNLQIE
jgi:hypothetical protein